LERVSLAASNPVGAAVGVEREAGVGMAGQDHKGRLASRK